MSVDIVVIRGEGDIPGEDVVDLLIGSEAAAIARGRNEVDANSKIKPTTLVIEYQSGLRIGQTVQVLDASVGEVWYGKIRSVSLSVEGVDFEATLDVERAA